MIQNPRKLFTRIKTAGFSALSQFAPAIAGFALSWSVSRFLNISLWGEFAYASMLINLLLSISGYGSKDYILQKSSAQPANLNSIWNTDFNSRLILLLPTCATLFFTTYSIELKLLLCGWLLAGYFSKSFESRIAYDRKFLTSVIPDYAVYLILFIYVLLFKRATLTDLIVGQVVLHCLKSMYGYFVYRNSITISITEFTFTHFQNAFFFFLPQVIGFVGGKADFYISMPLLSKSELGKYQLLIGFLILFQGVLAALTAPYLKNIYRMPVGAFNNLNRRILLIGIPAFVIYLLLVRFTFRYFYKLEFSDEIFLISFAQGIPYLFYNLLYSRIFGFKPQYISWIHLITILVSVGTGILLIPDLGLKGSLLANCASQWTILIAIIFCSKSFNLFPKPVV